MLKIHRFVFNPFYENTYLIWDEKTKIGAVIDPGMYDHEEKIEFENFVIEHSISLQYCINTHCHIDHILGNSFVKSKYNCQLWIPQLDEFLLEIMITEAFNFNLMLEKSPKPDFLIVDNTELELGNSRGKFLFTPGHTPGEMCLYFEEDKVLFSGDVLFKESIGRTDLWGGSHETLINSITNRILSLPDDVKVMPGHESNTTIGHERKNNSFFID